jgi:hypothetical protein
MPGFDQSSRAGIQSEARKNSTMKKIPRAREIEDLAMPAACVAFSLRRL